MKKNIILLFVLSFMLSLAYSCSNSKNGPVLSENKLKVSDFSYLGEWHNDFLINVDKNFNISQPKSQTFNSEKFSKESVLKALLDCNKSYARTHSLPFQISQEDIENTFDKYYQLADYRYISSLLYPLQSTRTIVESQDNSNILNIETAITKLQQEGFLSEFSVEILEKIVSLLKQNHDKILSDFELKENIKSLIKKVDHHGYQKESPEGTLLASVLSISIYSLSFWEENPDKAYSEGKIAPWVGADIAGALIGGTTGAISSYAGSGHVSWKSVAISAGSGAIAGSTGIVGKAGKWLSSLF